MEENYTFKKYIYISANIRADLENVMKESKIYQSIRFINTYDIELFFRTELKNLKGIDYLIIDLSAFCSSKDNEIIDCLKLIRQKYDLRIIIIAEGYKQGDFLLGKIFNLGIYNIITTNNDYFFIEELKKTLTPEGMTFGNAMKYQVEDLSLNIGTNKTIVKENYIKVKQTVTIGIASAERHQGATTLALNLAKYINSFENISACYIENNNHNSIQALERLSEAIKFTDRKMIRYKDIDCYEKPENIAEIQKYEYSFYIYDFGAFNEMSDEMKNNFISRDLKLIVSGSKVWEEEKLVDCLFALENDKQSFLFVNFIKNEDREKFKKSMGNDWEQKINFSELILDPFETKNKSLYENILHPYMLNQTIKEEKKKFAFPMFKRKRG